MLSTIITAIAGIIIGAITIGIIALIYNKRAARRAWLFEKHSKSTQRMAELGAMTGGLAHEIKNPLSTVGLNVQLLREDLNEVAKETKGTPAGEQIQRIEHRLDSLGRETNRLREILDDFLRFAGRMELDLKPTNINALIDELVDFYQPQASQAKINLRLQLTSKPVIVNADSSLLKQAILNLLINATQAMSTAKQNGSTHGGANELMLRTDSIKSSGQQQVLIHIIDTGPGIDSKMAEKIFHPYVSMRRGGTGLGLPTTRRIVEEHHGHIEVRGEQGRGSDFTITLPGNNTDKAS